jgi:LmbE family N-acetylglucosaminyl deacetylase
VKIAVVSPHREDAAFSLGLAIGTWLTQGHAVEVINCFTRSEHAPFSDADSVHANDRMSFVSALRKREDAAWMKLYLGPKSSTKGSKFTLTDLNLKDAPLRLHCEPNEVFGLTVNLQDKSLLKIRKTLDQSGAQAMVLPLVLGGHIDHLTARDAALSSGSKIELVAFYEELPQAAAEPAAVSGAVQDAALASGMGLAATFADREAVDVDAAVARKRRIAWCYDSQIDEDTTTLIAEACRSYAGRERMWASSGWIEATAVG